MKLVAGSCSSKQSKDDAFIASMLSVGARFGASRSAAELVCSVQSTLPNGTLSATLALTSLPLLILSTRWPLWDDAIIVSATGAMRSARLGIILNATTVLLLAAGAAGASPTTNFSSHDAGDPSSLFARSALAMALFSPDAVIAAAQIAWAGESASLNYTVLLDDATSAAADFSVTLSGASRIVLFAGRSSRQGALSPPSGINATLGGVACNISAASVYGPGEWAVLDTPSASALCASEPIGECGYVPLTLSSAPLGDARGASLSCPPFCPGVLNGRVIPLAVSGGFAVGADAPNALPFTLPSSIDSSLIRQLVRARTRRTPPQLLAPTAAALVVERARTVRCALAAHACGRAWDIGRRAS